MIEVEVEGHFGPALQTPSEPPPLPLPPPQSSFWREGKMYRFPASPPLSHPRPSDLGRRLLQTCHSKGATALTATCDPTRPPRPLLSVALAPSDRATLLYCPQGIYHNLESLLF